MMAQVFLKLLWSSSSFSCTTLSSFHSLIPQASRRVTPKLEILFHYSQDHPDVAHKLIAILEKMEVVGIPKHLRDVAKEVDEGKLRANWVHNEHLCATEDTWLTEVVGESWKGVGREKQTSRGQKQGTPHHEQQWTNQQKMQNMQGAQQPPIMNPATEEMVSGGPPQQLASSSAADPSAVASDSPPSASLSQHVNNKEYLRDFRDVAKEVDEGKKLWANWVHNEKSCAKEGIWLTEVVGESWRGMGREKQTSRGQKQGTPHHEQQWTNQQKMQNMQGAQQPPIMKPATEEMVSGGPPQQSSSAADPSASAQRQRDVNNKEYPRDFLIAVRLAARGENELGFGASSKGVEMEQAEARKNRERWGGGEYEAKRQPRWKLEVRDGAEVEMPYSTRSAEAGSKSAAEQILESPRERKLAALRRQMADMLL